MQQQRLQLQTLLAGLVSRLDLDALVAAGTVSQGAAREIEAAVASADWAVATSDAKQTGRPRKVRAKQVPELGGHPLDGE